MLRVHLDEVRTKDGACSVGVTVELNSPPAGMPSASTHQASATLEELDSVLKVLLQARHQLKVALQHHAGCAECTLDKIEGAK